VATALRPPRCERGLPRRGVVATCLVLAAAASAGATAGATHGEGTMPYEPTTPPASPARPGGIPPAVALPESLDGWTRSPHPRRIEPAAIFEYMDGAGELYLAYRFDHLDVVEFASPTLGEILVELYWMRTSDDAYGLLSGDWGGEPVSLKDPAPGPRALYGAGLLRVWSGNLYARVMATRESEGSRRAVLAFGRAIVAGRPDPPPPRLATSLPLTVGPGLKLRPDSVCFLRSHLVLNSVYFVSQRDILGLGPTVEAATARYAKERLLLVRYVDAAAARLALEHFRAAYLPEAPSGEAGFANIEDGWAGFRLSGRGLAIVFEASDREAAASLIAAAVQTIENLEASHE
jgi:hypothetical protein